MAGDNYKYQDKINKLRFESGIEYLKDLDDLTKIIQTRMLGNLPSNYPKDLNTNLAGLYKAIAEELGRLQIDASHISDDKYYKFTRTEYLFQILGDLLFLDTQVINESLNDDEYKNFLLRVKDAYLGGSRPANIQSALSDIVGLPVTLKEIYLSLRVHNTSYTLKDTHRMFFDISMDSSNSSNSIGVILESLSFFIDLLKPAHTLYQTRLIWTENSDRREDCTPRYDTTPISEVVYYSDKIYEITYLLSTAYKNFGGPVSEGWTSGVIVNVDRVLKVFYTSDNNILVYNDATVFYNRDSQGNDTVTTPSTFQVGDTINYFYTVDSSTSSDIIKSDWIYTGTILSTDLTLELIYFVDGSKLVYNSNTLFYTRDGKGEYRIDPDGVLPGKTLVFHGKRYISEFKFYNIPQEVQDNYYKQFDQGVIDKPYFQENVKKFKDIRPGFDEGPNVIVENGEVKVIDVESRFYDREGAGSQKEITVYRYSLYIEGVYKAQFSIESPEEEISVDEAKNIFATEYGYSEIIDPNTNYEIKITTTGKLVSSTDNASIEAINDVTQACDRRASCQLQPYYEDTRKYWTWPDLNLTSGFIVFFQDWVIVNNPGEQNVPGAFVISSDPNEYVMPYFPVMNQSGQPASPTDLMVYVNGLLVNNAVETLDPWTGVVTLNFIPPYNSTVRVDYYYSKRFPNKVSYLRQYFSNINLPMLGDLGGEFTIAGSGSLSRRLLWPFPVSDPVLRGDDLDYQMDKYPILTQEGKLATTSDIKVSLGQIAYAGYVTVTIGSPYLTRVVGSFASVQAGDTIVISVTNYLSNTLTYTVEEVVDSNTIKIQNPFPNLPITSDPFKSSIVKFIEVPDAVDYVRPLLGHVRINFLPTSGSVVKFDYYFEEYNRYYEFIPDDIEGYSSDTIFNSYSPYTLLIDQSPARDLSEPITDSEIPLKIGYRYRAFELSSTAVLNSSDTLRLNSYSRPSKRGSFKNNRGNLNQETLAFSPEYLTDNDKNLMLNDKYLEKDIPATTVLSKNTPLFIDTFSDDGHYKKRDHAEETDTYEGSNSSGEDVKGKFNIEDPDKSGDIDYNSACDYSENKKINLYSDLKVTEFTNGGYDLPLSTISDGNRTMPIRTVMIDQYFPNRELRITDYLDFINKVPENIKTGVFQALNGSKVLKSHRKDALWLARGDNIIMRNVPTLVWSKTKHRYETLVRDQKYTIVNIFDFETAEISVGFEGISGEYEYELSRDYVVNVDVLLAGDEPEGSQKYGVLQRRLVLNGDLGFSYGIPNNILIHLPSHYELNFTDPDPDPYPRNPDNPSLNGIPTGNPNTLFTNYTGQPTVVPFSSEVVKADGHNILGTFSAGGITGPSGSVDLGITGANFGVTGAGITGHSFDGIEDINNRYLHGFENPKYNVPAGESGIYDSYSESKYRIKWRDWDQDMLVVTLGETGSGGATGTQGVMVEPTLNMLDDLAEGIRRSFWDVTKGALGITGMGGATGMLTHKYFFGTILESSEQTGSVIPKGTYQDGLVELNNTQVTNIEYALSVGLDPMVQYPGYHLNDATYELRKMLITEVLHDNSTKVTEIRQYKPVT